MDQPKTSALKDIGVSNDAPRLTNRLLVVGWDGVELATLRSLLADGRLPNLGSLVESGSILQLTAPRPVFLQAAWTSLATGKRPHEHGILHEFIPNTAHFNLCPITRRSRKCSAIWNILGSQGLVTHNIGWPVSHPAESLPGISVSDRFLQPLSQSSSDSLDELVVLPIEALFPLIERRVSPAEAEEISLAQLLPAHAIGLRENAWLEIACRDILAQTATLFRASRWCLEAQPWNFAACVFPGIRRAHELAAGLAGMSPAARELGKHVIAGCYEQHDLLLGQILSQVDESTHVVMISPTGAQEASSTKLEEQHNRTETDSRARATGLAVFAGPNVKHSPNLLQRSVLDIAPTILAMFGLPTAEDMSGQPIQELFEIELTSRPVKSWDTLLQSSDFQAPTETNPSPESEFIEPTGSSSVEHLFELGYVDPVELAAKESVRRCYRESEFNRATSLLDAGLVTQAIDVLTALKEQHEDFYQSRFLLAESLYRTRRFLAACQEIDSLKWNGYEHPQLYLLTAAIEFAKRDFKMALEELACTQRGKKPFPGAAVLEGNIHLRRQDFPAAQAAFEVSINTEGPSATALDGLSAAKIHLGDPEAAAMHALDAIELSNSFGRAHYHLGVALVMLNRPEEAIGAFRSWGAVEPRAAAPYRWMAYVFQRYLHGPDQAKVCLRRGREIIRLRRQAAVNVEGEGTSIRISEPSDLEAGW